MPLRGCGRRYMRERAFPSLGFSIWDEAAAASGGGGGPLLEEGEEELDGMSWFDEDDEAGAGAEAAGGGLPRYLRPPAPDSAFCLLEGLPQDALVCVAAFVAPAELMRLAQTSKVMAARAAGPGGAHPWLQKCLQAWNLPESTALSQLSPGSRALDFAALYPDIVAWPSDIETDARRPLRRSPSTLALIQGRGHSGAFKVVDWHTVQFAGEGLGQGNRAVRATLPFPPLEDPTNRLQRARAGASKGQRAGDASMWELFTRGLQHFHLPPPSPATVVPLSLAASVAAAAAAGSLSTATAAALMSSGYYYSATAAAARGPNANANGTGSSNATGGAHRAFPFPASFFPSYLSASLAAASAVGGGGGGSMGSSAAALFSASAPASLAAFMAQHMPRVPAAPTATAAAAQTAPLPSTATPEKGEEAQQQPEEKPCGPRAFSAPWTRPEGSLEVRPRLVAYYEVAILPRDREGAATPTPAATVVMPVQEEEAEEEDEEEEPIFMVDEEEEEEEEEEEDANELAALLLNHHHQQHQQQQQQHAAHHPVVAPQPVAPQQPPEGGNNNNNNNNNCVAVGLAGGEFPLEGYMPGWDTTSYAFHSDDGGIFHGTGIKVRYYGPRFGAGDTVGCGLDYARREIFFTLNGRYLGAAFEDVMAHAPLYPTVGIDSLHPVSLNFGEAPFAFDLDAYQGLRATAAEAAEAATSATATTSTTAATTHVAPAHAVAMPQQQQQQHQQQQQQQQHQQQVVPVM